LTTSPLQDAPLLAALEDGWRTSRPTAASTTLALGARAAMVDRVSLNAALQYFKPHAQALQDRAVTPMALPQELSSQHFDRVLLWPSTVRAAARGELVLAWQHLHDHGELIAAQHNDRGARSLQTDAEALFGTVVVTSRHRCRTVHISKRSANFNAEVAQSWLHAAQPHRNEALGLWTQAGVFAADRIDAGSALLLRCFPEDLQGEVADLGAGVGVLSLHLARRCHRVTRLDLYEADARAVVLAERNFSEFLAASADWTTAKIRRECSLHTTEFAQSPRSFAGRHGIPFDSHDPHPLPCATLLARHLGLHWHDVTTGLPRPYDIIVSNPPFHASGDQSHELGLAFIRVARQALRPGGELWLVANRHLPYEDLLQRSFASVDTRLQADGYKVLHARKPH